MRKYQIIILKGFSVKKLMTHPDLIPQAPACIVSLHKIRFITKCLYWHTSKLLFSYLLICIYSKNTQEVFLAMRFTPGMS